MDPVLAKRFAKQQEKVLTGESAVDQVGSVASKEVRMDPILAIRMARQQEKELTGQSAVEEVGSMADTASLVDPMLAERLAEQQAKIDEAEGGDKAEPQIPSTEPDPEP